MQIDDLTKHVYIKSMNASSRRLRRENNLANSGNDYTEDAQQH